MATIRVLQHSPAASLGWIRPVLDRAGATVDVVALDAGERAVLDDADGVIVLGGAMGAYDEARYPFLVDEKRFLEAAVDRGVPVLGICLGSQLLADALGGKAYLADRPEAGFLTIDRTPAGRTDPVIAGLDRPVLVIHQDTFTLPPGAELLAYSNSYSHAFRYGSALAVQFHAEADPDILATWMKRDGLRRLVRDAGVEPEDLLADSRRRRDESQRLAEQLFTAWVEDTFGG